MSNPPQMVYRDFADDAEQPITNLVGTATLIGGDQYLVTGTSTYLLRPVQGATSTGAQADGPSAGTAVARTAGGSIAAGTYDIQWTFWDGAESLPGPMVTVTTTGSTSSIVATLPTDIPATALWAYGYRQKDTSGHSYRFATVTDLTQRTFIDTQAEASISSNPEPAGSAPPAGRLTFFLAAPADVSDPSNGSAIISYSIVIAGKTYYTTTFAYSGTPVELGTVLSPAPSLGILTRVYWDDAFASDAPLAGKVAVWRINRDCTATDTHRNLFASQPWRSLPADSVGHGYVDLKPNAETDNPGGWYTYQLIDGESQSFSVVVPMPDAMGHPNGFRLDELVSVLIALPGQQIASMANIQAVASNVADTSTTALTTADSGQTEVERIRGQIKLLKGGAVWDVAPSDSSVNIVVGGVLSSQHTGLAIVASAGHLRGRHLAGFPGSRQVTLSAPATAAGSGATLTTISGAVMAGDMHGNGVTLTTGTGPTAGKLFSITFADAYNNLPTLVVKATNAPARQVEMYAVETTSGVDVYARVTPMAATALIFGWLSAGY